MKRLRYNPKVTIAAIVSAISIVTTGCGATISDKEELEQAIESLEHARDGLENMNSVLESTQTQLEEDIQSLKEQKQALTEEVKQLEGEKDAIEARIDFLQNQEFDIDNLYVVNYSVLYGENDYYQAKPYYQIATRESIEQITEECPYLAEGEDINYCIKKVFKTIENTGDYIFYESHIIGADPETNETYISVLSNKKSTSVNSIESLDQTMLILESFMVPLFDVIQQKDYAEVLTREQLMAITEEMNQGDYFDSSNQLITKRSQQ